MDIIQNFLFIVIFVLNIFLLYYKKFYVDNDIFFCQLKLKHKKELVIVPFCFFICYIVGFFSLYHYNFSLAINLLNVVNYFKVFLSENGFLLIILFYINVFILYVFVYLISCHLLYKHFLRIHFYIISKYPMNLENTFYDDIREKVFHYLISSIKHVPIKYIRNLKKRIGIIVNDYTFTKCERLFLRLKNFYALFILLLLVLYDIVFNNFVLTKFYYFLPVVFLYTLLTYIDDFDMFTKMEEYDIACYFYIEKVLETKDEVFYANGHSLNKKDFNEDLQRHFPGVHIIKF